MIEQITQAIFYTVTWLILSVGLTFVLAAAFFGYPPRGEFNTEAQPLSLKGNRE